MTFDPCKPAQDMTAIELMVAHIAMGNPEMTGNGLVRRAMNIYAELELMLPEDESVSDGMIEQ